jgi:hypothetical protein
MAKTPEKTPRKTSADIKETSSTDPIQAALENLQDSGLGSLTWMGTAWTEAMSNLGSEIISFVADRIQEDVKAQHEILHCKNLTELQQAQAAFLERAYVQYTVETGKILKLGADVFPPVPSNSKSSPV